MFFIFCTLIIAQSLLSSFFESRSEGAQPQDLTSHSTPLSFKSLFLAQPVSIRAHLLSQVELQALEALDSAYEGMIQKTSAPLFWPCSDLMLDDNWQNNIALCKCNLQLYNKTSQEPINNIRCSNILRSLFQNYIWTYTKKETPFFVIAQKLKNIGLSNPQIFLLSGTIVSIITDAQSPNLDQSTQTQLFESLYNLLYKEAASQKEELPKLLEKTLMSLHQAKSTIFNLSGDYENNFKEAWSVANQSLNVFISSTSSPFPTTQEPFACKDVRVDKYAKLLLTLAPSAPAPSPPNNLSCGVSRLLSQISSAPHAEECQLKSALLFLTQTQLTEFEPLAQELATFALLMIGAKTHNTETFSKKLEQIQTRTWSILAKSKALFVLSASTALTHILSFPYEEKDRQTVMFMNKLLQGNISSQKSKLEENDYLDSLKLIFHTAETVLNSYLKGLHAVNAELIITEIHLLNFFFQWERKAAVQELQKANSEQIARYYRDLHLALKQPLFYQESLSPPELEDFFFNKDFCHSLTGRPLNPRQTALVLSSHGFSFSTKPDRASFAESCNIPRIHSRLMLDNIQEILRHIPNEKHEKPAWVNQIITLAWEVDSEDLIRFLADMSMLKVLAEKTFNEDAQGKLFKFFDNLMNSLPTIHEKPNYFFTIKESLSSFLYKHYFEGQASFGQCREEIETRFWPNKQLYCCAHQPLWHKYTTIANKRKLSYLRTSQAKAHTLTGQSKKQPTDFKKPTTSFSPEIIIIDSDTETGPILEVSTSSSSTFHENAMDLENTSLEQHPPFATENTSDTETGPILEVSTSSSSIFHENAMDLENTSLEQRPPFATKNTKGGPSHSIDRILNKRKRSEAKHSKQKRQKMQPSSEHKQVTFEQPNGETRPITEGNSFTPTPAIVHPLPSSGLELLLLVAQATNFLSDK